MFSRKQLSLLEYAVARNSLILLNGCNPIKGACRFYAKILIKCDSKEEISSFLTLSGPIPAEEIIAGEDQKKLFSPENFPGLPSGLIPFSGFLLLA